MKKIRFALPLFLLLSGSFVLVGCSTDGNSTAADAPTYQRLPAESRLPAGVANTARNTGNPPEVLNPHSLSDH